MHTTSVADTKTRADIIKLLEIMGATQVILDNSNTVQQQIQWTMPVAGYTRSYTLPVRVEGVTEILQQKRSPRGRKSAASLTLDRGKARMIAWRQALRWLEAMAAYIATGQMSAGEIFLPFMATNKGTVYSEFIDGQKQLTRGQA